MSIHTDLFDENVKKNVEAKSSKPTKICEHDFQDLPGGEITMVEIMSVLESLELRKALVYD